MITCKINGIEYMVHFYNATVVFTTGKTSCVCAMKGKRAKDVIDWIKYNL